MLREKVIPQKPLHRHYKKRFWTFLMSCCLLVSVNLYILFSQPWVLLTGGCAAAFITAGRETFTGEKCSCSSSEKNRGASEKFASSNFLGLTPDGCTFYFYWLFVAAHKLMIILPSCQLLSITVGSCFEASDYIYVFEVYFA